MNTTMKHELDTNQQQIKEALNELNDTMRNVNESWFWKKMQCEIDTLQKSVHLDQKQLQESGTVLDDDLSTITTSLDYVKMNDGNSHVTKDKVNKLRIAKIESNDMCKGDELCCAC